MKIAALPAIAPIGVLEPYFNYGVDLIKRHEYDEAFQTFTRIQSWLKSKKDQKGNLARCYANIALCQNFRGYPEDALYAYYQADCYSREAYGVDADIRYSLALQLLLCNETSAAFSAGWKLHMEHRVKARDIAYTVIPCQWLIDLNICIPNPNRLFVHCEQGFGDIIMMSRFLKDLRYFFDDIILIIPKELEKLFNTNFPFVTCKTPGEHIDGDENDYQCSIMDLPAILNYMDCQQILAHTPYIQKPVVLENSHNIGICWRGNPDHPHDYLRSIPIERFAEMILQSAKSTYVVLDHKADEETIKPLREAAGQVGSTITLPFIKNVNHLQETICMCRAIISCDSFPAHLAGSMGVPVELFLHTPNDWRWGLTGNNYWYENFHLHRQKHSGKWSEVFCNYRWEDWL